MRPRDVVELLVLGGLWGGSFLFMRVAAPEFGPVPLIAVRVSLAALALLPLAALRGRLGEMRRHAGAIVLVGVVNSALPFSLFAFATLSLTAGFTSVLNSTAPLFAGLVAWLWLSDRLSASRVAGLVIGFLGVVVLVWGKTSFKPGGSGLAVGAGLLASLLYGVAANLTKRRLAGVDPLAIAGGSQLGAAAVLVPVALWQWPRPLPRADGWGSAVALALGCTAIAYVLYFRLIANVGPARAIAVTYLIPVFGILWGAMFLREAVTPQTLGGCAVILCGTALATGLVRPRRRDIAGAASPEDRGNPAAESGAPGGRAAPRA